MRRNCGALHEGSVELDVFWSNCDTDLSWAAVYNKICFDTDIVFKLINTFYGVINKHLNLV